MNWAIIATKSARKALAKLPDKERFRILTAFQAMQTDPFGGDVKHLKSSEWRRRIGNYRIFYDLNIERRFIVVTAIMRRTSTTYSHP
jgi:mRNA-degrading endonuclease RelE of RelBE toxin-antitoxin system